MVSIAIRTVSRACTPMNGGRAPADALHFVDLGCELVTSGIDRPHRVGTDHLDRGIALLERAPDAADRAAGTHSGDEMSDASLGLAPDLGPGGGFVGRGIGRIEVL